MSNDSVLEKGQKLWYGECEAIVDRCTGVMNGENRYIILVYGKNGGKRYFHDVVVTDKGFCTIRFF